MPADPQRRPDRVGVAEIEGVEALVGEFGGTVVALADLLGDGPASMVELIAGWDTFAPEFADPASLEPLEPDTLEWRAPVNAPKLICAAANYSDQLEEMERSGGPKIGALDFPFSFLKSTTSLTGSGQPVPMPGYANMLDWEAELAIVIGRPERAATDPLGAVFGYAVMNELSLREFVVTPHPLGLDAVISKGFDGGAPMGPWITLAAGVPDPTDLPIVLRVNGEVKQDSSTAKMVFSVAELVSFYARVLTLEVGDVIATGTPAGVGMGMRPQQFLEPGDICVAEIGQLGTPLVTPIVESLDAAPLSVR